MQGKGNVVHRMFGLRIPADDHQRGFG